LEKFLVGNKDERLLCFEFCMYVENWKRTDMYCWANNSV
jgi:hypothetical protein